jgi:hypothetical protein
MNSARLEEALQTAAGLRLQLVRDFPGEQSALRSAIPLLEGWLPPCLELLERKLPLPRSLQAFVDPPFYRPPGSYRSFYCYPAALREDAADTPESETRQARAVLAIKGMEPASAELGGLLRGLIRPCYSPHNVAEHLIFEEGKIPGCVSLAEAQLEAEQAAELQSAHLRVYGQLARLPLPLFVFRHSSETEEAVVRVLESVLSRPALAKVVPRVKAGLGVLVYHYPSPPVRVRELELLLSGLPFQQRMFALLGLCDPEQIIDGWVREFTRMLHLGFVPGSLASLRTGSCCQLQNACINGGFVDLDSITRVDALADDTALYASLQLSSDALLGSVRALVAGSQDPTRAETLELRVDLHHLRSFLLARIRAALQQEAEGGSRLDPRILAYFVPDVRFETLVGQLGTYFPAATSDFAAAAGLFEQFGTALVSAACAPASTRL